MKQYYHKSSKSLKPKSKSKNLRFSAFSKNFQGKLFTPPPLFAHGTSKKINYPTKKALTLQKKYPKKVFKSNLTFPKLFNPQKMKSEKYLMTKSRSTSKPRFPKKALLIFTKKSLTPTIRYILLSNYYLFNSSKI